jgi:hypothetical protein
VDEAPVPDAGSTEAFSSEVGPVRVKKTRQTRSEAFSSEVVAGSHEENASKRKRSVLNVAVVGLLEATLHRNQFSRINQ